VPCSRSPRRLGLQHAFSRRLGRLVVPILLGPTDSVDHCVSPVMPRAFFSVIIKVKMLVLVGETNKIVVIIRRIDCIGIGTLPPCPILATA